MCNLKTLPANAELRGGLATNPSWSAAQEACARAVEGQSDLVVSVWCVH